MTMVIGRDALSYYDEATHQWKAEPGKFEALIGTASDQIAAKCEFELK